MTWLKKIICFNLLIVLGYTLGSCDARPLYLQTNPTNCAAQTAMGQVEVDVIADRPGQILRNLLRDRLGKYPQSNEKCYSLKVNYKVTRTELGIRQDYTASRANLTLTGNFTLTDCIKNQTIYQGKFFSIASYLVDDAPFVTRHSEQKALEQTLEIASHDIEQKLYLFFECNYETNAVPN